MNLQQTLDQSAAWHLKQLQMLCPEGTKATIILRLPKDLDHQNTDAVMILGDEPDTKEALFAALRVINGVKSPPGQHHGPYPDTRELQASHIRPNAMVPIGSAQVLDTQPAPEDMFSDMNGGVVNVGGISKLEQG